MNALDFSHNKHTNYAQLQFSPPEKTLPFHNDSMPSDLRFPLSSPSADTKTKAVCTPLTTSSRSKRTCSFILTTIISLTAACVASGETRLDADHCHDGLQAGCPTKHSRILMFDHLFHKLKRNVPIGSSSGGL